MEFTINAKKLLEKAGWFEGRNISKEELKLPYDDYPQFVIDFLREYGNLSGECEKQGYTPVINEFDLEPAMPQNKLMGDNDYPVYSEMLGRKLFPLGGYYPDGYYICCDADGRVYKMGEYCFHVGTNLYVGVENIILLNTLSSLQLDEDSGKWWNMDAEYSELPAL
ncbi:MAG: hypothetical protein GQ574_26300 [Crocinitomix sp.]|nr:hypothetical protein [Crocinitomix sp.]